MFRSFDPDDTFSGGTNNVAWTFAYNPASQITTETRDNDAYAITKSSASASYSINGLNQYTSVAGSAHSYDANGNLTGTGAATYTYDIENRLVKAVAGGTTTNLIYDPLGRLYQEDQGSNATTTRFLNDGDALALEYNSGNNVINRYVHGSNAAADDPLVWYSGANLNNKRWLHADHLGSIVAWTNSSGGSPSLNKYDEYGLPAATNSGRFQYTGQAWIGELGLYYYKARFYHPGLGRFMQTDPVGYEGGINLYTYVEDDPVNRIDPTGNLPFYDPVRADAIRGGFSYFAHIGSSWRFAYDLTGANGREAQNRARLVYQLADRGLASVQRDPQAAFDFAKDWARENKAYLTGRFGTGIAVGALTGPLFGSSLAYQALYGAALNAMGQVVSQLESGGYDASSLSSSTLGAIAAVGIAGGSVRFDTKSGDVTATVKSEEIGSRIPRSRTVTICNVNEEPGC